MPPSVSAVWLPTVDRAYGRMEDAIARAAVSVRLETYIFKAGGPGDRFRDALRAAVARGVRVRVLLDSFGSAELPPAYWDDLRGAGGEVGWFNPLALRRIVFRDHRKLLVVDDARAFVGGFNIGSEYEGDGVAYGWRDLGLELQGPPVGCLAASFDLMWEHRDFRHPRLLRLRLSRLKRLLRECGSAEVMATGPGLNRNPFRTRLTQRVRQAGEVRIAAAYFVPSFRLRRALGSVVRRGGRVQLLLPGRTDVAIAQAAGRTFYRSLLRAGIQIAEYQPQILHAKLAIADDAVFVGSSNIDARSLGINYELNVCLTGPVLAAEARALFAADWARARPIDRKQWRTDRRWTDRWAGAIAKFLLTKVDPWLARRQLRRLT